MNEKKSYFQNISVDSKFCYCCIYLQVRPTGSRGGSHNDIDMVYVYVPAFWGPFSRNLV